MIFGAIGDDLTGSVELAGMLAAGGASVALVTSTEAINVVATHDAVVVALRSRVAPVAEAVSGFEAAGRALLAKGARQLFFKYCATFDSTPAGNIGPCADVLDRLTGEAGALFCPTFPEPERTVYRGHHFVGDQLLSDSPKRDDPLTPMRESDLVKVLQRQTAVGVGLIRLAAVEAGAAAILGEWDRLRAAGHRYAIVDALSHDHLRAIAAATVGRPLMTGGSSVAGHYPALWRTDGLIETRPPVPLVFPAGPAVVLAGSCADRTREQIEDFGSDHPVLRIDITVAEPETLISDAENWVLAQGGQIACVTTAAEPAAIAAVQDRLGRDAAARRAESVLGGLARRLVDRGHRRIVVAGGETSGAVVEALGIDALAVAPFGQPGVGLCVVSRPTPLGLCLKSGKLGAPDLFRAVLGGMGGHA